MQSNQKNTIYPMGPNVSVYLQIWWYHGTEIVPLHTITQVGLYVKTKERWENGDSVYYNTQVKTYIMNGNRRIVELIYSKDDNRQFDNPYLVHWGVSKIRWNPITGNVRVDWQDEDPSQNGKPKTFRLFRDENPTDRLKTNKSVILRPDQQALRDILLSFEDKKCVLTGEAETAALDAAHIVPVKAGGRETIKNAILLRADLHRLFDAGLFWFEVANNEAIVACADSASENYRGLLEGKKLPAETFTRVAHALGDRLRLKDSRGPGRSDGL